jgi:hypothetical protein
MLARQRVRSAAFVLCAVVTAASAQEPQEPPVTPRELPAPGTRIAVPALTPVYLRLEEPISSNVNKPGDHFRITIAEDVRVGDGIVIAAGTEGVGEVVHAARSGGGGKAGELILAARLVHVGDQDVWLRSFAMGRVGKDRTEQALATSVVAGPFAMFVRGGAIVIPSGTLANAKTAEPIELPVLPAAAPPPAEPTPEITTTEGRVDERQTG